MALTIVKYPAKILTRPARRLERNDSRNLAELFEQMVQTMQEEQGVGLAAPQIDEGIRFITAKDTEKGLFRAMVNPQIIKRSADTEVAGEGCLSFPGQLGDIERAVSIEVRFADLDFNEQVESAEGYFARVLQHEIDHINGITIIDRAIGGLYQLEVEQEDSAGPTTDQVVLKPQVE